MNVSFYWMNDPFAASPLLVQPCQPKRMAPLDLKPEHDLREASKNNRTCNGVTETRRLFLCKTNLFLQKGRIYMRKLLA
jgi:hypothetical protein